ncbi:diguanylate cyclase [Oryzomicrobium terrae]|uniref:diguanylate cyclase n=1 Tax=Oryzomicrobium terrae TaxID=1735038 RepID=A0A5C1E580_9RHOO|nr:sensor domain-containing diguanylate cyclase [Oryzomicrobium terrae]QEL64072.1 diguanylate cyclase [Oryzomicrobium terrae]
MPTSSSSSIQRNERRRLAEARAVRTVFVSTLLFLLGLWGLVAYWGLDSYRETQRHNEDALVRLNRVTQAQTDALFKMAEVFMAVADRWLAARPGIDPRTDADFIALVEGFRQRSNGVIDIRLIDAQGGLFFVPSRGTLPVRDVSDRDYFRQSMAGEPGKMVIADPVVSRLNGHWIIPLAWRLSTPASGVTVLFASIEHDALAQLYEAARMPEGGSIALVRRDGTLLVRAPFNEQVIGKNFSGNYTFTTLLPKAPSGFAMIAASGVDGQRRLMAYSTLPDYPLVLAVTSEFHASLAPWRRHLEVVVGLALILSFGALFFAWRLARSLAVLARHHAELQRLATTDILTGCANRGRFLDLLGSEFARAKRYGQPLAVLVADLDYFKRINDTHGHAAGDAALVAFARVVRSSLRSIDVLSRFGGEEFAILLPNTDQEAALQVAERVRALVDGIVITLPGANLGFTASLGVAALTPADADIDALLARADRALYAAKADGRNCVRAG